MSAYNFDDEPEPKARPNGHARASQPIEWPEPIDILADPQLTGLATVDATCLPRVDPGAGRRRGRPAPGRPLPHRGADDRGDVGRDLG